MPTGRTHDRITLTCLPVLGGTSLWLSQSSSLTLSLCGGFLFSGLMFGPDLDIYSLQFKRWGPLKVIWRPYQHSLRHRSWLSHGPIVGTGLRLIYLGLWLTLIGGGIAGVVQICWGWPWDADQVLNWLYREGQQYDGEGLALLAGLELGAMSHSLSDWLGSTLKAMLKLFSPAKPEKSQRRRR